MFSYITVLSNWLLGYDRYQRLYSKTGLTHSTYPNEFYVLHYDELQIGVDKATKLLTKLDIDGDRLVRIETVVKPGVVRKNIRNGLGWVIDDHKISVHKVFLLDDDGVWVESTVEDVTALAFQLDNTDFTDWVDLKPLTFSFLPVAIACQASCLFCFSGSSISVERKKRIKDFTDLNYWCERAASAGAERFVLTGGGEPTILPFEEILECLNVARNYFPKTVIINNGVWLSKCEEDVIAARLKALKEAGLTVLSFSYHHFTREGLKKIMGIDTNIEKVLKVWQGLDKAEVPVVRLICVLQEGGIGSVEEMEQYLRFAAKYDVTQVCFKELYVSSTTESLYSGGKENLYSKEHQVSLSVLVNWLEAEKFTQTGSLAWGAPIYDVVVDGKHVSVAAYTEPSVGWERSHGVARSWNFMADQKCFASLEDEASEIVKEA